MTGAAGDDLVRVLVLQWAKPGRVAELAEVEDALTSIARRHAIEVTRDRASHLRPPVDRPPPDEVHVLTFADERGLESFLADPDRPAWSARLRDVLEDALVLRLADWDD